MFDDSSVAFDGGLVFDGLPMASTITGIGSSAATAISLFTLAPMTVSAVGASFLAPSLLTRSAASVSAAGTGGASVVLVGRSSGAVQASASTTGFGGLIVRSPAPAQASGSTSAVGVLLAGPAVAVFGTSSTSAALTYVNAITIGGAVTAYGLSSGSVVGVYRPPLAALHSAATGAGNVSLLAGASGRSFTTGTVSTLNLRQFNNCLFMDVAATGESSMNAERIKYQFAGPKVHQSITNTLRS